MIPANCQISRKESLKHWNILQGPFRCNNISKPGVIHPPQIDHNHQNNFSYNFSLWEFASILSRTFNYTEQRLLYFWFRPLSSSSTWLLLPEEVLPGVWPHQEEPPGGEEGLFHPGQRWQRFHRGGRAQVSVFTLLLSFHRVEGTPILHGPNLSALGWHL